MNAELINRRLRAFLMFMATLALVTTLGELWLVNHYKEGLQFAPWIFCSVGLVALAVAWIRPNRATIIGLRVVMVIVGLGGLSGSLVHLISNVDFQSQMHPGDSSISFLLDALKGAAPLLAPGVMVFAALDRTSRHLPAPGPRQKCG